MHIQYLRHETVPQEGINAGALLAVEMVVDIITFTVIGLPSPNGHGAYDVTH